MRLVFLVSLSLRYRLDVIVFVFQPLKAEALLQPGTFLMFNQLYLAAITVKKKKKIMMLRTIRFNVQDMFLIVIKKNKSLGPVQAKGLALAAHSCFFNVAIVLLLLSLQ